MKTSIYTIQNITRWSYKSKWRFSEWQPTRATICIAFFLMSNDPGCPRIQLNAWLIIHVNKVLLIKKPIRSIKKQGVLSLSSDVKNRSSVKIPVAISYFCLLCKCNFAILYHCRACLLQTNNPRDALILRHLSTHRWRFSIEQD